MVVLDASALIPLARVGHLGIVDAIFDDIATTTTVEAEVLVEGQPGTAALDTFLDRVETLETPKAAPEVAELEGIAVGDASVILAADERSEILLANDKALIEVARSHDIECWWVTTLLLGAAKDGILDGSEAQDLLYDLVQAGMNLAPAVYAQVQRQLAAIADGED